MSDVVAQALAAAAVAGLLIACLGAWRSRDALTGQHFVAAAGTVPVLLLAGAVVAGQGFGSSAVLAILAALAVLLTGPATATAFGRAVTGRDGPHEPEEKQ